jgi:hypothetical protein
VNWAVGSLGTATWALSGSAWRLCPEALKTFAAGIGLAMYSMLCLSYLMSMDLDAALFG